MRASTLPSGTSIAGGMAPWKLVTALRSIPLWAMPSTTAPPKQVADRRQSHQVHVRIGPELLHRGLEARGHRVHVARGRLHECLRRVRVRGVRPLPYMSSANPTYPARARRRACSSECSFCPAHSWTTTTPGRFPAPSASTRRSRWSHGAGGLVHGARLDVGGQEVSDFCSPLRRTRRGPRPKRGANASLPGSHHRRTSSWSTRRIGSQRT